jgi:hypothetical protein
VDFRHVPGMYRVEKTDRGRARRCDVAMRYIGTNALRAVGNSRCT